MRGILTSVPKLRGLIALAALATTVPTGAVAPTAAYTPCCISLATYGAFGFGDNEFGQLGTTTTPDPHETSTPVQVHGVTTTAKQVAAGADHSVLLKTDGTVAAWGYNGDGELGDGTLTNSTYPVAVPGLAAVTKIAVGGSDSFALRSDGTVWAWGYNQFGELGDGTVFDRTAPVRVANLTGITDIAGGSFFSLALSSAGTVYAWGYNYAGVMGTAASHTTTFTPTAVPGLTGIVSISAGDDHALAVKNDGTVWSWGDNECGELGVGDTNVRTGPQQVPGLTGVVAVSAGFCYSVALLSNGTVRTWGDNNLGQLGNGTTTNRSSPGTVLPLGSGGNPFITQISASELHVLARTSDQRAIGWGYNEHGEIGIGNYQPVVNPTDIPIAHVQQVAAGGGHSLVMVTTQLQNLP